MLQKEFEHAIRFIYGDTLVQGQVDYSPSGGLSFGALTKGVAEDDVLAERYRV